MAAVFNNDRKSIEEARARILQSREVKITPIRYKSYLDDCESDNQFCDDDADCISD